MSVPKRPSRPMTRVPQPGAPKPPTSRAPAPAGKTTRGITQVGARVAAPKKSGLPLILGACGAGALLLIVVVALAASGGSPKKSAGPAKKQPAAAPDVSALERDGESKCEQGYAIVQKTEGMMTGRELSVGEKAKLKTELDRGLTLMVEGMNKFDQANAKSGRTYDVVKYSKAIKAARMKLGELGSVK